MTNDTKTSETLMNPSDICTLISIKESTLRKYCIMLEDAGYNFHKNEFGHRGFFNKDVIALKRLIEIKNHPDMTLKQACNAVVMWIKEDNITDHDITDITENEHHNDRYNELLEQFQEFKQHQQDFNKELINQLKQQQDYIKNSLEDRDKKLMETLRETQETKKLIAAAEETKKRKGFFKRMLGK